MSSRLASQRSRTLHTLPDLARGGGQTIVRQHLAYRDETRYDSAVVHLGPPADMVDALAATGARLHALNRPPHERAGLVSDLVRLIRAERIDLLHVHGPLDRKVAMVAAALCRIPVVCHLHSDHVHLGPNEPSGPGAAARVRARLAGAGRDRLEHRTVAHYLADSAAAAARFAPLVDVPVEAMGVGIEPVTVPGGDLGGAVEEADRRARRAALGLGEGPVLAKVARLVEGKGHRRVIEALAKLRASHPDVQLLLVGDGPLRRPCLQLAEELGVAEAVRFAGDRADVAELLGLADVFVFASEHESLGLAPLEAMAAGLPVVLHHLPSLEPYARHEQTALVVDQGDGDGLVSAIGRLLDNRAEAATLGRAGARLIAERCAPDATARSFEQVYDRVLGRTDGPLRSTPPIAPRDAALPTAALTPTKG